MCNRYDTPLSILNNEAFPINPAYLQNKIFTYRKNNTNKVINIEKLSNESINKNNTHDKYPIEKVSNRRIHVGKRWRSNEAGEMNKTFSNGSCIEYGLKFNPEKIPNNNNDK